MKKYDVLILCQYFYPEYVSSATLPYETAEDLVKKGLKVKVVCGYPKEYVSEGKVTKKENKSGIYIHRLNYLQLSRKSKIGRLINYFSFIFSIIFNWYLLLDNKCTIVYSNPPILPLITAINKKLFRIKYIFVSYDVYPNIALITNQIKENSFIHLLMKNINKIMDKNVDKVIVLSSDMKRHYMSARKQISREKIIVIPNWYDDKLFNSNEELLDEEVKNLRQQYKVIVLYSGNMGICQDVDIILDTAKKLRENEDILFVFTGHGQKANRLNEEAVQQRLNNVKFYGFLSGQKYSDMLKAADCHVVSLVAGVEGLCVPSKTYSYMAVGRPMIAIMNEDTDIAQDINENRLGCVISSGDSEQFKDYLIYLLNNQMVIKETGNRVRSVYLDKYPRNINTNKYSEVIQEIINR